MRASLGISLVAVLVGACSSNGVTPDGSNSSFAGAGSGGKAGGSTGTGGGFVGAGGGSTAGAGGSATVMCTQVDDDADGIANHIEGDGLVDTDKDGTPDSKDTDSDNDTWPDAIEGIACGAKPGGDVCIAGFDSDGDGVPDFRSLDSDSDGVPDVDEKKYDPDGSKCCRTKPDCDGDGAPDIVELAAGTSPTDGTSKPPDSFLYFVVPFQKPEQTKDFEFSTGVKIADIYFLIDATNSMQPTIDNAKASLDTTIIPTILNGDPTANPPIPAIPGAYVGIGTTRDVPWLPYGYTTDQLYVNGASLSPPQGMAPKFTAPAAVSAFLGALTASGGGDNAAEGWSQGLFMAVTGAPYSLSGGGSWTGPTPSCGDPSLFGVPCFRPSALPIFVLITDSPTHDGFDPTYDYDPTMVVGAQPYAGVVDALKAKGAKVVGVPVATGQPGAARGDLVDLATKTGSLYHNPAFGGSDDPLVTPQDTMTGDVSKEVVRLIGLLAGQGLHNVTTARQSYDCPGMVDCDGDAKPDPVWHNPSVMTGGPPFDATSLITAVTPIPSTQSPTPYSSLDEKTFFGVRGDAKVSFRVHAKNDVVNPPKLMVVRALIRVQTPNGQELGGPDGVKSVYLIIPRNPEATPL